MMFRLERFRPRHLSAITASEPGLHAMLDGQELPATEWSSAGPAYTALDQGKPFAAAGLIMVHGYRAIAWAWIGRCGPALFQRVHREAMRGLIARPIKRIEATVRADHERGHRWCRLLGFELEHPELRGYLPDGSTAALYARIRP